MNFPIFRTKMSGPIFRLEDPRQRRSYFQFKAGIEIKKINRYLRRGGTFMGFLLGPKNSGKGTYAKLLLEALTTNKIAHLSVGDLVRNVTRDLTDARQKKELVRYLREHYRGFITVEQALAAIGGRDTKTLLPNELILSLTEREIDKLNRRPVLIDGFPRNLDQISTAIYFRTLMGYRDDPDFFVFIDVPEAIIDERFKQRVVCPRCQTPRSLKLLRTKEIGYEVQSKKFYLKCDTTECRGAKMVAKEGDELGIETIRDRLEIDKKVMNQLWQLQGVPRIVLRNSIPVEQAPKFVNDYELTPSYRYHWEAKNKKVLVTEEPWVVPDENGLSSYSLLPAAVTVAFIKQLADTLGL